MTITAINGVITRILIIQPQDGTAGMAVAVIIATTVEVTVVDMVAMDIMDMAHLIHTADLTALITAPIPAIAEQVGADDF
jgi:hypothetical protein